MSTTTSSPTASSGIDLKTLWITAVSSAAAAYVTSKVWSAGTLAAAAFTPVLVAVLREALAKSTEVVTRVVPVKGVVRSTRPDGSSEAPDVVAPSGDWAASDLIAQQPGAADEPAAAVPVAQAGEISYHSSGRSRARNWRVAVITGLLGFVIAAVVFTVPELVAGSSASGGGSTTLFGGHKRDSGSTPAVTTTPTTAPAKTVTTPPQSTVTVPPQTVTTPPPQTTTPEVAPQTTVPDPGTTTPVVPPVAEPPPAEPAPG